MQKLWVCVCVCMCRKRQGENGWGHGGRIYILMKILTKQVYFYSTNISDMHSLSKFDHQVGPLRELSLRKLSGLHRGKMCFFKCLLALMTLS